MKRLNFILIFILFLLSCSENKIVEKEKKANPFYDIAFDYRQSGQSDSAFRYFNKAKDLFLQEKDSFGMGKCLVNMAIISTNNGDYFGGQEISLSAIQYFNKTDMNHLGYIKSNLNNLGISFYNLKKYDQAISFYQQSLNYALDSTALVIKNNIANAYREKKDFKKSLELYEDILKYRIGDRREYSRILTNISITKWLQDSKYNAAPNLLQALHIRKEEKNLEDLSASYAHLSDYYATQQPDSALFYAHIMYKTAQRISNSEDKLLALQKLVRLSTEKEAKRYFEIYQDLNDSVDNARNIAKNQFALIRYETEKHKAENLKLQKDNTENKYQIIKQRALLIGTLILTFATIVIGIIWYKKRKQRLELATQNAIHENQLKTSKKVHDIVANGLYRVMTEIENNKHLDRDLVLDKLEDMYEKSRDLSYEELRYNDKNFHAKITDLLKSFAIETTKVITVGNTEALWKRVDGKIKYEIEHILQELMVNMKKHSEASHVAIRFEKKNDKITIYYADNGIGMLPEKQFKNGLTNTGNRIISIDGEITFDTKVEKGLKIHISFPVS